MEDFVAHTSRWRTAIFVAGSLGFVVIGIWFAGVFGPVPASRRAGPLMTVLVGWCGIIFFGMCAFLWAKQWWKNEEVLRICRSGIRLTPWSDQTIPWDEINDVTEWQFKRTKCIILHLRDPSRFRGKGLVGLVGRANRTLTGGNVSITLSGTDRKFDEAMVAIATFRTNR